MIMSNSSVAKEQPPQLDVNGKQIIYHKQG